MTEEEIANEGPNPKVSAKGPVPEVRPANKIPLSGEGGANSEISSYGAYPEGAASEQFLEELIVDAFDRHTAKAESMYDYYTAADEAARELACTIHQRYAEEVAALNFNLIKRHEEELNAAEARGWQAAVSCVQYCSANWAQDYRRSEDRAVFLAAADSLSEELVNASPAEWLKKKWRTVQEWTGKLNAEEKRHAEEVWQWEVDCKELVLEVSALKASLARAIHAWEASDAQVLALKAEVERLRGAMESARDDLQEAYAESKIPIVLAAAHIVDLALTPDEETTP